MQGCWIKMNMGEAVSTILLTGGSQGIREKRGEGRGHLVIKMSRLHVN